MSIVSANIVRSALRAHQIALEVISHNIANADTPGYSRQSVALGEATPHFDPAIGGIGGHGGWLGGGVQILQIERVRDAFLDVQIRRELGPRSNGGALSDIYDLLERVMGEPDHGGLSQRISGLFAALSSTANAPQSTAQRQALLNETRAMTDTFRRLAGDLQRERVNLNTRVRTLVDEVNNRISAVADLNAKIGPAITLGSSPNDLLDQRDRLLDELSALTGASYAIADDGTANVFVGGKPVIFSSQRVLLGTQPNGVTGMFDVTYTLDNSVVSITSGELDAVIEARDTILPGITTSLDSLAAQLVTSVNALHQRGFGLDDQPVITHTPGAPPAFASVTLGPTPGLRAGTWQITTTPAGNLSAVFTPLGGAAEPAVTGTITAGGTNTTLIPGLVLTAPAVLLNATDAVVVAPPQRNFFDPTGTTALTISLDAAVDGQPRNLALAATSNAPADGQIGQRIADLTEALTMNGATQSFGAFWRATVTDLANDAHANESRLQATDYVVQQLQARRDSVSGVSLEEEGIDLLRVQRAYEAAARVLSVQDSMMASLLEAFR